MEITLVDIICDVLFLALPKCCVARSDSCQSSVCNIFDSKLYVHDVASSQILQKVLHGCSESMLGTMAPTACQFMEEPGMAVQMRESKHPYNNNTNFEVS